jgi:glycerophosphoryl diester phosphodiesterase
MATRKLPPVHPGEQASSGEDMMNNHWMHFSLVVALLYCGSFVSAQERQHYMPSKIGWQEDCHTDVIHKYTDALAAVPERATAKTADAKVKQKAQSYLPSPKHGGVYVVAHRGAHNGIPENSLPAYQKAIDLGADFVEIDVRTTKDGNFVSVHNATIDAYVKGGSGKVKDMTLAELRALDIGLRVGPEWKGTRIPTFEEILVLCKGRIGIYLDLKDGEISKLVKIVKKHEMERDVFWYTWPANIKKLKQICDKCVGMPDPIFERNLPYIIRELRPRVIAATWDRYSKSFVETCHAAGAIVIVDESDPSCWADAIAWGSDGIQTDHPEKLIEFLKAREAEK